MVNFIDDKNRILVLSHSKNTFFNFNNIMWLELNEWRLVE